MTIRANLHLDDDAYRIATSYAQANDLALGAAVSQLLRRTEELSAQQSPRLKESPHGYLIAARTGRKVTPEMVKELSEDELG